MGAWETVFSELFQSYIAAATAGDEPGQIPAALLALPTATQDSLQDRVRPSLLYVTTATPGGHGSILQITTTLTLLTSVTATPPSVAFAWTAALRNRIRDADAFADWLMTLAVDQRTGFRFLKWPRLGEASAEREVSQHTGDYAQPIVMRVVI